MDRYKVAIWGLGNERSRSLSAKSFERFLAARGAVLKLTEIEELHDLLSIAFETLEREAMTLNINYYVRRKFNYEHTQELRQRLNFHFWTFLNAATSVRDQFPKLKIGNDCAREVFKGAWVKAKEVELMFRFFELLRNQAQHEQSIVKSVSTKSEWIEEHSITEQTIGGFVHTSDLVPSKKLSAAVIERFESELGRKVNILHISRFVFGKISEIMKEVRAVTGEFCEQSIETYLEYKNWVERPNDDYPFVSVRKYDSSGEVINSYDVFTDLTDRLKAMRQRTLLTNSHNHFVSGRLIEPKG